jgi:RNA polymerase sigma-54 factor
MEEIERPSFENFLSKPSTLTDHLMWQLGSIPTRPPVRQAAEVVIGNLNEDGYLIATDEELLGIVPASSPEIDAAKSETVFKEAAALGLGELEETAVDDLSEASAEPSQAPTEMFLSHQPRRPSSLLPIRLCPRFPAMAPGRPSNPASPATIFTKPSKRSGN